MITKNPSIQDFESSELKLFYKDSFKANTKNSDIIISRMFLSMLKHLF